MRFKCLHQRIPARLTVKIWIKISKIADEFGIVNQRIPSVEGLVVEVILPVFPVMGNDAIAIMSHIFVNGEAPLETDHAVIHDIQ